MVGCPGPTIVLTDVGTRPPPPDAGMQPMCGRKLAAERVSSPTYVPVKTAELVVVIPGLTGLPSVPVKERSIAVEVNSASRPPTMYPRGHLSWYSTALP